MPVYQESPCCWHKLGQIVQPHRFGPKARPKRKATGHITTFPRFPRTKHSPLHLDAEMQRCKDASVCSIYSDISTHYPPPPFSVPDIMLSPFHEVFRLPASTSGRLPSTQQDPAARQPASSPLPRFLLASILIIPFCMASFISLRQLATRNSRARALSPSACRPLTCFLPYRVLHANAIGFSLPLCLDLFSPNLCAPSDPRTHQCNLTYPVHLIIIIITILTLIRPGLATHAPLTHLTTTNPLVEKLLDTAHASLS